MHFVPFCGLSLTKFLTAAADRAYSPVPNHTNLHRSPRMDSSAQKESEQHATCSSLEIVSVGGADHRAGVLGLPTGRAQHGHRLGANAAGNNGKIAITTSSEEARKEFLAGRDLQEKLRITDSIAHFDKAISLDPNFALAELNRANVSPTCERIFRTPEKSSGTG